MRYNCDGHFERSPVTDDYYRRLYESGDVKRIFSAEHTGLLERDTREHIESGFRRMITPATPICYPARRRWRWVSTLATSRRLPSVRFRQSPATTCSG